MGKNNRSFYPHGNTICQHQLKTGRSISQSAGSFLLSDCHNMRSFSPRIFWVVHWWYGSEYLCFLNIFPHLPSRQSIKGATLEYGIPWFWRIVGLCSYKCNSVNVVLFKAILIRTLPFPHKQQKSATHHLLCVRRGWKGDIFPYSIHNMFIFCWKGRKLRV